MNELKDFLQAWLNLLFDSLNISDKSDEEKKEIKDRLTICYNCSNRKKFFCGVCGCPLLAKVRSVNGCPKNKW